MLTLALSRSVLTLDRHLVDLVIDPFDFNPGEERMALIGWGVQGAVLLHAGSDGPDVRRRKAELQRQQRRDVSVADNHTNNWSEKKIFLNHFLKIFFIFSMCIFNLFCLVELNIFFRVINSLWLQTLGSGSSASSFFWLNAQKSAEWEETRRVFWPSFENQVSMKPEAAWKKSLHNARCEVLIIYLSRFCSRLQCKAATNPKTKIFKHFNLTRSEVKLAQTQEL